MAMAAILYFLLVCMCLASFTLVFCFVVHLHHKHKKLDHIPGPKRDGFFWGNVKGIQRLKEKHGYSGVQVLNLLAQEYGPVMVVWLFHLPIIYVSEADLAKKVLITCNYPKDAWSYNKLAYVFGERFLGKGLVTETDHEKWKVKRLSLNPAFHKTYLKELTEQFNASCDVFLEKLTELADGKTEVLMADEFNKITLDIIAKVAFGMDSKIIEGDSIFPAAFKECLAAPIWCLTHPFYFININSYAYQSSIIAAIQFVRDTGKKLIDERRKAIKTGEDVPSDILTYILKSTNEDSTVEYEELIDHFVTFFVAGQETTAALLSFLLAEIGKHPEVEKKLSQEVEDVIGSRQFVTNDDLSKLQYTNLVIKETLRLHPSVPSFTRLIDKDDELGGYSIPAGTPVNLLPYALHRSPKYWKDPEKFIPERFAADKEDENRYRRYAYFPFSLGPRHCIGQTFAEFESKVLLSRFIKSFKFQLVPGQDFGYEDPKTTLSAKDGIRCVLTLR
ncbi:cholesterol 24-hydroxylase-like [Montipora foliosa]